MAPGPWGRRRARFALEWIRTGCQATVKADRFRSDYVDMMIAVHGTYFNGVMTGDARLTRLHDLTRALLEAMGGSVSPAYSPAA